MYTNTDLNNDGFITENETSICLLSFFGHFLDKKLAELATKIATARLNHYHSIPKSVETIIFLSKKVESFIDDLEKIALNPEVTSDHDQKDPASPRKERDLL